MDYESLAFRNAPDATLVLADRVIVRASLMVQDVFGWHPRELEGQSIRLLYPGQADFESVGAKARHALQDSQSYSDKRFMLHKDGSVIWMEARGRTMDRMDPYRLAIWVYRPVGTRLMAPGILTGAELRVAQYVAAGFTSKRIAQVLGSSHRTVEVHRANMMRKLGAINASELVATLFEMRG